MNPVDKDNFFDRINFGRTFLFLGFDYFNEVLSYNPVLSIFSEETGEKIDTFSELYLASDKFNSEQHFNKIKRDINSLPTNNVLDPISNIKWNAIYTSTIDDLILTRFKNDDRITIPICRSDKTTSYSRSELSVHYLFGLFSRIDDKERVPNNRKEFLKRTHEAQMMLNHLVESMTPMDTLIISGWNYKRDPLSPEQIFQVLSKLSKSQVYLFGNNGNFDDELIHDLISDGIIIPSEEILPKFITAESSSFNKVNDYGDNFDSFIRVNDKAIEIPPRIRRLMSHHGQVIEDKFFTTTNENLTELFGDFLFESSRVPIWKAYPNNLDFQRDYYKVLYELVINETKKKKVIETPIILHGPTGTGKSVSMARLCFDLYKAEKFFILHLRNQRDSLDFKVIDDVCEWAESENNLTTVICWDGMSDIDTYQNLSSYLSSRGRKQIVIGTTYKLKIKKNKFHVESQEQFSPQENISFIKYLNRNEIIVDSDFKHFDSTFLVTLYRILPETRFAITTGVVKEANHIKQVISQKIKASDSCENVIANAFKKAFEKSEHKISLFSKKESDISISDIIDDVMIFGKFGIETPFDILMRVYPNLKISNIGEIFKIIDIIRWSENSFGDIYLSPRNTLEAEIYCKRITSNNKDHIKKLLLIIGAVEQKKLHNCSELKFCADIIRAFGPNGTSGKEYSEYYQDISRAIGNILQEKRIINTQLMLLQANLLREYGRVKFDNKNVFYQEYYDLLLEALSIIQQAIDNEEKKERHAIRQPRQPTYDLITLYGEKASILGTLANQCKNDGRSESLISSYINDAINTLRESFKYKLSNYISLDSIAWIVMNYVKDSKVINQNQLKLILDAIGIFNEYTLDDFEVRYQTDFLHRKASLYDTIGRHEFSQQTLQQLKKISPEDYHYYKILKIIGNLNLTHSITEEVLCKVKSAILYIEKNHTEITRSYKLNVLHLRMYWIFENKCALLQGERVIIRKPRTFWEKILFLSNAVLSTSYNNNTIRYIFIKGVALFHLGLYKDSDDIFRYLARESDSISGPKRIFKSYLMANEDGVIKFSGEIISINAYRNRGEVYIDELKTKVMFFPSDFNVSSDDKGSILNSFHVAFNFLSPIADNEKYYKEGSHEHR
ncbi:P-loop NTPase [Aeromonas veronii]|uniref:P-loop NTPase n=1 Tax=Aeromonas veronii TaxID=654 RepID=UPI004055531C